MNADTKKALARLEAAISKLEVSHSAQPVAAEKETSPKIMTEIAAIKSIVDEAISLLDNDKVGDKTG